MADYSDGALLCLPLQLRSEQMTSRQVGMELARCLQEVLCSQAYIIRTPVKPLSFCCAFLSVVSCHVTLPHTHTHTHTHTNKHKHTHAHKHTHSRNTTSSRTQLRCWVLRELLNYSKGHPKFRSTEDCLVLREIKSRSANICEKKAFFNHLL